MSDPQILFDALLRRPHLVIPLLLFAIGIGWGVVRLLRTRPLWQGALAVVVASSGTFFGGIHLVAMVLTITNPPAPNGETAEAFMTGTALDLALFPIGALGEVGNALRNMVATFLGAAVLALMTLTTGVINLWSDRREPAL